MLAGTEEDGMPELLIDEDEDDVSDIVENQDPVHTAVEAIICYILHRRKVLKCEDYVFRVVGSSHYGKW